MTDHNREEREALIEDLRGVRRSAVHALGKDDVLTIDRVIAIFEQAHTPTSDERGWSTGDRQEASAEAHRRFDEWAETRGQDIAGASINGFILGAEWWNARRTVQGEPTDNGHDGWCECRMEPQGEQGDAS